MNIARSSLLRFSANGLGMVVKTIGLFYFARELGPTLIGTFFLFQALSGVVSDFSDLDISNAVSKRISEGGDVSTLFWTAVAVELLPISVLSIAVFILRPTLNSFFGEPLALLFILRILLKNLHQLSIRVLEGELRVAETAGPLLAHQLVFVGSGALLLSLDFGVLSLVYALLLGSVAVIIVSLYRASIGIATPSLTHARSLFDFFKFSFVTSASDVIFSWTDVFIIGLILTQTAVGIYEIPWRVTALVLLLGDALAQTIFPQISDWSIDERTTQIQNLLEGALLVSLYLVVPAFFGVFLLAEEILLFGFGAEYTRGWQVLVVVAAIRIVEGIDTVLRVGLQALNQPQLTARAEVISVSLNVVLNVVLVLNFGIVGAAVGSLLAIGMRTSLNFWFLRRLVAFTFPRRRIAAIFVASVGMAVVVHGLQSVVPIDSLWVLFAVVGGGVVSYGTGSLLLPALRGMIIENVHRLMGQ